jgi:hypothetical protein
LGQQLGHERGRPIAFVYLKTSIAAGTHTINLQWKTNASTATLLAGAGTGTTRDIHPQFGIREV